MKITTRRGKGSGAERVYRGRKLIGWLLQRGIKANTKKQVVFPKPLTNAIRKAILR